MERSRKRKSENNFGRDHRKRMLYAKLGRESRKRKSEVKAKVGREKRKRESDEKVENSKSGEKVGR